MNEKDFNKKFDIFDVMADFDKLYKKEIDIIRIIEFYYQNCAPKPIN